NNGTSWSAVNTGLTITVVQALAVSGTNLFAGVWCSRVFLSTNNGTSWSAVNTGLTTSTDVRALAVSGTNLFAGTWGGGVWRRPLSEMITSVQPLPGELPAAFRLEQNYPNPFNPVTTIEYHIPVSAHVLLKVFDLLGREVATLVNEGKAVGVHTIHYDASGLAGGVYFYRIQAGNYVEARKLVLLR
ncbi:MAG: T9SS type A sorting domain-containing protein, partial [Bacteroidetes bacterium]|nr:T9SS type A sorting domain-containing protein [Bacteroidota bacterium]